MAFGHRRRGTERNEPGGEQGTSTRRTAIVVAVALLPCLIGLYVVALYWSRPDSLGEQVRLDQFLVMVNQGEIGEAVILDADNRVVGQSVDGPFWMAFGGHETSFSRILATLESGNVPTSVREQWGKGLILPLTALLPTLLLIDLVVLAFLLVRGRGDSLLGFGRSGARRAATGADVTFADVAGQDEALEELAEIRDYLARPDRFLAMGALAPKGILLAGPPGCGKTLLARAVAGEAVVPFFSMSGSDFVEMFVGVGASRIRDLFRTAKAHAPCIVFIDELDAVGRGRVSAAVAGQDEREATLNQLLVEMDGFERVAGVVVLADTNRPDVLDPALLRPGRFDRRIGLERSDVKGRRAVLDLHARGKPLASGVDLEVIARRTPGFSGADLANVVNEGALLAARRGRHDVGQAELVEAVERVVAGPERRTRVLTRRDRRLIAHHEAGHAVVSAALSGTDVVHKVSIVSRGHAGGMTWFLREEEWVVSTRSELEDRLAVLLAGRAGEELLIGEPTTGARGDLEQASRLARRMVAELGMGELLGLVPEGVGLGHGGREVSDRVVGTVDADVERLLASARARARQLLEDHRSHWEALATTLQDVETVEGPDLELALSEVAAARRG
jgi:cell division protease FtsH